MNWALTCSLPLALAFFLTISLRHRATTVLICSTESILFENGQFRVQKIVNVLELIDKSGWDFIVSVIKFNLTWQLIRTNSACSTILAIFSAHLAPCDCMRNHSGTF